MRYLLLLWLILAASLVRGSQTRKQSAFVPYEGKYKMIVRGKAGYILIATKSQQLTITETWSGVENKLKHLSGDNFIIELRGWAVKFNRDNKGNIMSVGIMGHDVWTKVK